MPELSQEQRIDLQDLLLDLQHDLGKYIRMPLAFLHDDAAQAEVREALRSALLETRRGVGRVRAAREIWQSCLDDGGESLTHLRGFERLRLAVEQALAWEHKLAAPTEIIDRVSALEDVSAVAPAVRALIEELNGETKT